jgi:hypothetical protein
MIQRASLVSVVFGLFLLLNLPSDTAATALTYKIGSSEDPCFFTWADTPGKKVGFYFAVSSYSI